MIHCECLPSLSRRVGVVTAATSLGTLFIASMEHGPGSFASSVGVDRRTLRGYMHAVHVRLEAKGRTETKIWMPENRNICLRFHISFFLSDFLPFAQTRGRRIEDPIVNPQTRETTAAVVCIGTYLRSWVTSPLSDTRSSISSFVRMVISCRTRR